MNKTSLAYKIFVYVILSILTVIFVYPFFNMIMMSFMTYTELQLFPPHWLPEKFQFSNYTHIIDAFGYDINGNSFLPIFLKNTLLVFVLKTVGMLFFISFCAYGFSKIEFKGRNAAFMIVLSTIMIPGSVTMIPLFTLFKMYGWLDTLTPLWFPAWFGGGAMNIFLMRQYMKTIPNTLLESAELDGAGHFRKFISIMLPNVKPILFLDLLSCVDAAWGDFFTPMLYINSKEKWTVPLAVKNMVSSTATEGGFGAGSLNVQMATCVILSLIPLITFSLGQKNFIENVTLTGIKG